VVEYRECGDHGAGDGIRSDAERPYTGVNEYQLHILDKRCGIEPRAYTAILLRLGRRHGLGLDRFALGIARLVVPGYLCRPGSITMRDSYLGAFGLVEHRECRDHGTGDGIRTDVERSYARIDEHQLHVFHERGGIEPGAHPAVLL
jgi:hypothetical protein